MTHTEALTKAERLNGYRDVSAKVVRILPATTDPVKAGDNGWDVEVSEQLPTGRQPVCQQPRNW